MPNALVSTSGRSYEACPALRGNPAPPDSGSGLEGGSGGPQQLRGWGQPGPHPKPLGPSLPVGEAPHHKCVQAEGCFAWCLMPFFFLLELGPQGDKLFPNQLFALSHRG